MSIPVSLFIPPTPFPPWCPHVCSLCLCHITVLTQASAHSLGALEMEWLLGDHPLRQAFILHHGLVVACGLSPGGMHSLRHGMPLWCLDGDLAEWHPLPTLPAVGRKSDSVLKGAQVAHINIQLKLRDERKLVLCVCSVHHVLHDFWQLVAVVQ